MSAITEVLREHYQRTFLEFGATSQGVDWGSDEENVVLRHRLMHNLVTNDIIHDVGFSAPTLLDVGCGYGAFCQYLSNVNSEIYYTGIDVVSEMIEHGRRQYPSATFICDDFMRLEDVTFDYIVCNGILTQKLTTSIQHMDAFANALIRKMYSSCRKGIAFNIMSSKVNFMAENLYYRSAVEMLCFCLTELSAKVRIEHAYKLFEYTVYVYK